MSKIHCPGCGATGSTLVGLSCSNCGTYVGVTRKPSEEPLHNFFNDGSSEDNVIEHPAEDDKSEEEFLPMSHQFDEMN